MTMMRINRARWDNFNRENSRTPAIQSPRSVTRCNRSACTWCIFYYCAYFYLRFALNDGGPVRWQSYSGKRSYGGNPMLTTENRNDGHLMMAIIRL
ncbi:unnamed protein product [Amoebophrya sp. A25]|nr:unnamed protein product [Amoebophrya sp. A25]|eukprot:GSA25T00023747001.1